MKTLRDIVCIGFLFGIFFSLYAQNIQGEKENGQTTILLVGTMHWLPWPMTHNYNYLEDMSRQYKPQVICVEFTPPSDSISMKNFVNEKYLAGSDSLSRTFSAAHVNMVHETDSLFQILENNRSDVLARKRLVTLLFAQRDYGNSAYQIYQLYRDLDDLPKEERKGLSVDEYEQKFLTAHKRNEFGRVVFPIARERQIAYLYPIDNHTYEKEYNAAFDSCNNELKGSAIADEASSKVSGMKWGAIFPAIWGSLARKMNSYEMQSTLENMEAHLYPDSVSRWYPIAAQSFEKRNKLMAENILKVARQSEGKRIIVYVGASHVPFLKRYLQEMESYTVLTIPELSNK